MSALWMMMRYLRGWCESVWGLRGLGHFSDFWRQVTFPYLPHIYNYTGRYSEQVLPNHSCKSYCVPGLCIGSEGDVILCKPMPWSEYVIHLGSIEGQVGQL